MARIDWDKPNSSSKKVGLVGVINQWEILGVYQDNTMLMTYAYDYVLDQHTELIFLISSSHGRNQSQSFIGLSSKYQIFNRNIANKDVKIKSSECIPWIFKIP